MRGCVNAWMRDNINMVAAGFNPRNSVGGVHLVHIKIKTGFFCFFYLGKKRRLYKIHGIGTTKSISRFCTKNYSLKNLF